MQSLNNLLLIVVVLLFNFLPGESSAHSSSRDTIPFAFNLDTTARTSAGVYNTDGVLLRTLWNNKTYNEGTHSSMWDKKNDDGLVVDDSIVVIKVVSNNVKYSWEGIIGNNSDNISGSTKYHNFESITSMAASGNDMYAACDYNEAMNAQLRFNINDPNKSLNAAPKKTYGQQTSFVATDGVSVYWAGCDPFEPKKNLNYVFATQAIGQTEKAFGAGESYKSTWFSVYNSIIDKLRDDNGTITGLAVQKTGNLLFIAHGKLNKLHVVDKTTGQPVRQITLADCGQIIIDKAGNLWVQAGKTVSKYLVATDGTIQPAGISITNLQNPLAIGISFDNTIIAVCDGGNSQQVKAFNTVNGALVWTLGQAGGYATDPSVSYNKFFFGQVSGSKKTFIAFQEDGSFWVGDTENFRSLRYDADRQFSKSIMYIPNSRSCSVDPAKPSRVTSGYLEFEVDYSKKLAPGNSSWKVVKNWSYSVDHTKDDEFTRLINTTTLSNGRTYAFVKSNIAGRKEIVELPPSGNIRYTGILVQTSTSLYPDGNLKWVDDFKPGVSTIWYIRTLTGFDGNNNPAWKPQKTLALSTPATLEDPLYRFTVEWGSNTAPVTSSDLLISYEGGSANPDWASKKWHLGAIKLGTNKWMWKTAKGTAKTYTGNYPTDGSYDMGNGVEYPGGPILVKDENIFWNYHGEFWKQSQTNKWQHVNDDGLLIGIFGVTGRDVVNGKQVWDQEAVPEMAGNSLTAGITKIGEDYYIYHCDESHHGGVHQWKVSNLASVKKEIITVNTKLGIVLRRNRIIVKAIEKNNKAQVFFSVESPDQGTNYRLEKSTNNVSFTSVLTPVGDLRTVNLYNDNQTVTGKNYYRISYKTMEGKPSYSDTAVVNIKDKYARLEVAPNPISGNNISLQFNDTPAGNYRVSLINTNQQLTMQKTIVHSGNTGHYIISGLSALPKGIYHMIVEGNSFLFRKLLLN